MTGRGLGLTARDQQILERVQHFGVLTRDQFIALRLFSSKTRAKERLKRLVDAGHLAARSQSLPAGGPRLVYFVARERDAANTNLRKRRQQVSDLFLNHELGLVDVHIAFDLRTTIRRWVLAKDLEPLRFGLIPDSFTEYEIDGLTYCAFVEYDRGTETVSTFERKVRTYVELARTGRFQQLFHRKFFRVLVLTDATGRQRSLSAATARITDKIFRFTTLSQLNHQGLLSSIWWRPGAESPESLTGA